MESILINRGYNQLFLMYLKHLKLFTLSSILYLKALCLVTNDATKTHMLKASQILKHILKISHVNNTF